MIVAFLESAARTGRMGRKGRQEIRVLKDQKVVREAMDYQVSKVLEESRVLLVQWGGRERKETEA